MDPPQRGWGRGQGSLRVESSRLRSGPVSSGSPYTLGLDSSHPEQPLLGLPWPPRGWWNLTFQQLLTDLEKLTRDTHWGLPGGMWGAGHTTTRIESAPPDTSTRAVGEPGPPWERPPLAPQAPSASLSVLSSSLNIHTHSHKCMHVSTQVYAWKHMCTHKHIHVHAHTACTRACIRMYTYTHATHIVHMHTNPLVYTSACVHTRCTCMCICGAHMGSTALHFQVSTCWI